MLSKRIAAKGWAKSWLSAIVLCYGLGIVLGNTNIIYLHDPLSQRVSEISIIIAIPLLLYSTNVFKWLGTARTAFLSFGLFVLAGLLAGLACTLLYANKLDKAWELGGMITGLYTGGTPNMQAIGMAIEAGQDRIILLNTADILVGGLYLIFLTSVAHRFFGLFLTPYQKGKVATPSSPLSEPAAFSFSKTIKALLLTAVIVGMTVGITLVFRGDLADTALIMLLLTTLSIGASFIPFVQKWEHTFELGEYFLLIFSIALGMLADFSTILDRGPDVIVFAGLVLLLAVLMHTILSGLCGIDRDTTMIVATAALYGPAFVGQIASVIGNKQIVFSGILMGLFGYMIGNYLGIAMTYFLSWLIGS